MLTRFFIWPRVDLPFRRLSYFCPSEEYACKDLRHPAYSPKYVGRCFHSFTLCMDRTNWEHGSKNLNYLVVPIAWQGTSIPIV
ncbi:MAG: hypothetical protein QS721_06325 [Candidatus Endonucleobacter sp. (ex Gigantidas childressi)]|nr:hypothetical protein [Candidatus Endonucleobacter sp. (ex Gigantidas childressi)]